MTEFLDRLIARSEGLKEVIRPRTASLFEPCFQVSARVMPLAFGNAQFEEPGLSRAAKPHALRGETVQLNDREPVPIQAETAPNPSGQVTPVTQPGRLRSQAALPSVSSPAFLESRDVAAEIHPQPLEQPSAASMPRLAHATNVEPRSVQIAFAEGQEGQEGKTKSGEVPVFFEFGGGGGGNPSPTARTARCPTCTSAKLRCERRASFRANRFQGEFDPSSIGHYSIRDAAVPQEKHRSCFGNAWQRVRGPARSCCQTSSNS